MLVIICTDCIGSSKANYPTITTPKPHKDFECIVNSKDKRIDGNQLDVHLKTRIRSCLVTYMIRIRKK